MPAPADFLQVHRFMPMFPEDVAFDLVFDAAGSRVGFTSSYADFGVASGQSFLINIGWSDDTSLGASSEDLVLSEFTVAIELVCGHLGQVAQPGARASGRVDRWRKRGGEAPS